jgi:serine/threonine protein kinase
MSLAGSRFGPYEIVSLLGAGGMGEVYRARDTKLGREVAIKFLPPAWSADLDRLTRFEREARVLASLNHPNVGAIYGLEEFADIHAIVLELVEGETLAKTLSRTPGPRAKDSGLPVAKALGIARQIADALDAAHERGIVHRDLKPSNIVITPAGTVKVLDFGLAKGGEDESADMTHSPTVVGGTREGVILGTAAYMSPEQARGRAVDKRTDVWAFGCVLFEMLAGRQAFGSETVSDTIVAILDREPDWRALPAATPLHVRRLLERCLDKDAKRRLRDIGDARIELDDREPHGSLAPAPVSSARRIVAPIAAALIAALALVAVLQ